MEENRGQESLTKTLKTKRKAAGLVSPLSFVWIINLQTHGRIPVKMRGINSCFLLRIEQKSWAKIQTFPREY